MENEMTIDEQLGVTRQALKTQELRVANLLNSINLVLKKTAPESKAWYVKLLKEGINEDRRINGSV